MSGNARLWFPSAAWGRLPQSMCHVSVPRECAACVLDWQAITP
jgi:hypothetical protein